MRAYILCAGLSSRLKQCKLLIRLNGENCVQRQVRLLHEHEIKDITVILNAITGSQILNTLPSYVNSIITYGDHKNALVALIRILPCIKEDDNLLVTLGDLVYSEKALSNMINHEGHFIVFGIEHATAWASHRWGGEIFAIKFKEGYIKEAKEKIASLNPFLYYDWWNIPKQLNIPITHLEGCTDIDFEGDIAFIKKLLLVEIKKERD